MGQLQTFVLAARNSSSTSQSEMRNIFETRRREIAASDALGPDLTISACGWDAFHDAVLCVYLNDYDSDSIMFARVMVCLH